MSLARILEKFDRVITVSNCIWFPTDCPLLITTFLRMLSIALLKIVAGVAEILIFAMHYEFHAVIKMTLCLWHCVLCTYKVVHKTYWIVDYEWNAGNVHATDVSTILFFHPIYILVMSNALIPLSILCMLCFLIESIYIYIHINIYIQKYICKSVHTTWYGILIILIQLCWMYFVNLSAPDITEYSTHRGRVKMAAFL